MPVGYNRDNPLVIGTDGRMASGEPVTETPRRVRVLKPVEGLALGQASWVTGPGVQQHLDSGAFIDISNVTQKKRQWRVGAFTYSDPAEARRVGAAKGVKPVEIN